MNIQKAYIYGKKLNEKQLPLLEQALKIMATYWDLHVFDSFSVYCEKMGVKIPAHKVYAAAVEIENSSFMATFGGDGTFLDAVALAASSGVPFLGVNLGRMGFLAHVAIDEMASAFESIANGTYTLESRSMLRLEMENQVFGANAIGLNELTIHKRDTSSMIKIHAYLDDVFLNSYWADGIIVSTPTGSTAYSLSCGGPIILPNSGNFVITPVAPHSLNVRPVVIPDNCELKLKVEGRTRYFMVSLDSRSAILDASMELLVKKNPYPMKIIRLPYRDFPSIIREKLNWGLDVRN